MKKISGREKRLITIALIAILGFLGYQFGLAPVLDYYDRITLAVPKLQKDYFTARRLRERYRELDREIQSIRERVDERQDVFNPYNFLDTLAKQVGIRSNLDKITSDTEPISENYSEEIVSIRLKGVKLDKLARYLYSIENSEHLLTVKQLSIEPDDRNSELLDVEFEVSTFAQKRT